jgi:hypothetical protein
MKQNLIVYVCGRRTGLPDKGYAAIEGCASYLRSLGMQVISPIDVNINALGTEYSPKPDPRFRPAFPGLRADIITMMSVCNAIALMPGWEKAIGCRVEVAIAITFGFAFIDWESGQVVERPSHVTIDHGYSEFLRGTCEREQTDVQLPLSMAYANDSPARLMGR